PSPPALNPASTRKDRAMLVEPKRALVRGSAGRTGVGSEDAGRVLSPRDRGEEANFDPSPFFDDRAAFGEFHGFSEVAGRDECVTVERQWRSARADGCPLGDRLPGSTRWEPSCLNQVFQAA